MSYNNFSGIFKHIFNKKENFDMSSIDLSWLILAAVNFVTIIILLIFLNRFSLWFFGLLLFLIIVIDVLYIFTFEGKKELDNLIKDSNFPIKLGINLFPLVVAISGVLSGTYLQTSNTDKTISSNTDTAPLL